jgi:hypothetical protein
LLPDTTRRARHIMGPDPIVLMAQLTVDLNDRTDITICLREANVTSEADFNAEQAHQSSGRG